MEKPNKPCWTCGSNTWWQRPDGGWACGKCRPNPNPDSGSEPPAIGERYSPEVIVLRDRVIRGNDKLAKARFQIQELEEGEEKEHQWDRWNKAQELLRYLCSELQIKGYSDCLFIEDGKKTKSCLSEPECQGCPSTRKYWSEELMALPGPNAPRNQTEFVPGQKEFLEKLGRK